MSEINRHPLLQKAFEVCWAIEKCAASTEQTEASLKAAELLESLDKFIEDTAALGAAETHGEKQ